MRIKIYHRYPSLPNPIGETFVMTESILTRMQSYVSNFKIETNTQYYKSQSGYAGDRKNINTLFEAAEKVKRVWW